MAVLTLQNKMTFHGTWETSTRFGEGEVVFFTGMTGYQEVLTDPSYAGQLVVFTYPLIGQYPLDEAACESGRIQVAGVIVQTLVGSELRCWLEDEQIPVLSEIDTRALVHQLRQHGDQWGIMDDCVTPLVSGQVAPIVRAKAMATYGKASRGTIVCLDFGVKRSMVAAMVERGYAVCVVPYDTPVETIHSLKPEAILVSNGPGDPRLFTSYLETIRTLGLTYPMLGICMGHQLIALAFGASIHKQTYGHRGSNHPVRNVKTQAVWLTSQNHGYVVERDSLHQTPLDLLFEHVNDGTVEGVVHQSLPIMTAQFHPEASPGPIEARVLFDQFDEMIQQGVTTYV